MMETEVCIIGAGPAGTITSLFLSKNQVPHILVDRASFPREKVCGEFYDGRLKSVLEKLDPDFMQRMYEAGIIQDIRQYSYTNSKLATFCVNIPPNISPRVSTNRCDFDKYLLDEACKSAYVQYFEEKNIAEGCYTDGGILLRDFSKKFEIKAKTAILATGYNSPLLQSFVANGGTNRHFLLVSRGYYRGVEKPQNKDCAQIYFFRNPFPYYIYLVHLPKGLANVEIGILKDTATKYKVNPAYLLESGLKKHSILQKIFANATLEGKIKGAVLPKTTLKRPISAERVLLVGASGTSINPGTGWGVGHAAFEAMCAANQYIAAAKNNDFSAKNLSAYDQKVYKNLYREQIWGRLADIALVYGSRFLDIGIGLLGRDTWFSRKAVDLINSI